MHETREKSRDQIPLSKPKLPLTQEHWQQDELQRVKHAAHKFSTLKGKKSESHINRGALI